MGDRDMKILVFGNQTDARSFCDYMDTKVQYQDDITTRYAIPIKHPDLEQWAVPVTDYALDFLTAGQSPVDYTDDWNTVIIFKPGGVQ
jgi:hypothetical protein